MLDGDPLAVHLGIYIRWRGGWLVRCINAVLSGEAGLGGQWWGLRGRMRMRMRTCGLAAKRIVDFGIWGRSFHVSHALRRQDVARLLHFSLFNPSSSIDSSAWIHSTPWT